MTLWCPLMCNGGVGPKGAGEHAHQRHPADVGRPPRCVRPPRRAVRRGWPTVRGAAPRRCPTHAAAGAPAGRGTRRPALRAGRRVLSRCWRRPGSPGGNVPRATAVSQIVDERGDLDVLAGQVALHERLVLGLLDDPFDQRGAGVPRRREAPALVVSGTAGRTARSSRHRCAPAGRGGRRPRRSSPGRPRSWTPGRRAHGRSGATTTARGRPTAAHSSHWATVAGSIVPSRPSSRG